MKKKLQLQLSYDDQTDLASLLTYCKNNHPSPELQHIAQQLLIQLYQFDLFTQWTRHEKPKRAKSSPVHQPKSLQAPYAGGQVGHI